MDIAQVLLLGFTFNNATGLTATQAGTYLVTWFYGCVAGAQQGQPSSNNPQSYTIGVNGGATNASWTLQERQDTTNTSDYKKGYGRSGLHNHSFTRCGRSH